VSELVVLSFRLVDPDESSTNYLFFSRRIKIIVIRLQWSKCVVCLYAHSVLVLGRITSNHLATSSTVLLVKLLPIYKMTSDTSLS